MAPPGRAPCPLFLPGRGRVRIAGPSQASPPLALAARPSSAPFITSRTCDIRYPFLTSKSLPPSSGRTELRAGWEKRVGTLHGDLSSSRAIGRDGLDDNRIHSTEHPNYSSSSLLSNRRPPLVRNVQPVAISPTAALDFKSDKPLIFSLPLISPTPARYEPACSLRPPARARAPGGSALHRFTTGSVSTGAGGGFGGGAGSCGKYELEFIGGMLSTPLQDRRLFGHTTTGMYKSQPLWIRDTFPRVHAQRLKERYNPSIPTDGSIPTVRSSLQSYLAGIIRPALRMEEGSISPPYSTPTLLPPPPLPREISSRLFRPQDAGPARGTARTTTAMATAPLDEGAMIRVTAGLLPRVALGASPAPFSGPVSEAPQTHVSAKFIGEMNVSHPSYISQLRPAPGPNASLCMDLSFSYPFYDPPQLPCFMLPLLCNLPVPGDNHRTDVGFDTPITRVGTQPVWDSSSQTGDVLAVHTRFSATYFRGAEPDVNSLADLLLATPTRFPSSLPAFSFSSTAVPALSSPTTSSHPGVARERRGPLTTEPAHGDPVERIRDLTIGVSTRRPRGAVFPDATDLTFPPLAPSQSSSFAINPSVYDISATGFRIRRVRLRLERLLSAAQPSTFFLSSAERISIISIITPAAAAFGGVCPPPVPVVSLFGFTVSGQQNADQFGTGVAEACPASPPPWVMDCGAHLRFEPAPAAATAG
ncbi:hypothetical protein BDK51DRAFT_46579 [Blyttiomyces helicus]|uniref:Uncharacterized protein n=1 Tax=Blyttiomyces helicus TaxID=388810 RepID=A0A4P9WG01_9FUNG|nr:hypothetical protein BDK51DRAFT_46579 [Blyttiomyces helicus]|eukprot:RKO90268.1 hypothetical protein BDK51DRAFT_46579 [Blyttiomyces helicus]